MSLRFQIEEYAEIISEIIPILNQHWQEVALNKDSIKLAPDFARYGLLASEDALHIVTARDGEKLVGYYVAVVYPHLHYVHDLIALTDVYYLQPEYRKWSNGLQFFKAMQESLRLKGITMICSFVKRHVNPGAPAILERLGFKHTEDCFTKVLNG